jgi:hypothetical protein
VRVPSGANSRDCSKAVPYNARILETPARVLADSHASFQRPIGFVGSVSYTTGRPSPDLREHQVGLQSQARLRYSAKWKSRDALRLSQTSVWTLLGRPDSIALCSAPRRAVRIGQNGNVPSVRDPFATSTLRCAVGAMHLSALSVGTNTMQTFLCMASVGILERASTSRNAEIARDSFLRLVR